MCFISFTDSIQHTRVTVQIETVQQLKKRLNTGNLSLRVVTVLRVNFGASLKSFASKLARLSSIHV